MDILTLHDVPNPANMPLHEIRPGDLLFERMLLFRVTHVHVAMDGQYIRCTSYPVNWYSENIESQTLQYVGPHVTGTGRRGNRAVVIRNFRTPYDLKTERLSVLSHPY